MFEHRSRGIWILLLLVIATAAPARADGPAAGQKLDARAVKYPALHGMTGLPHGRPARPNPVVFGR